MKSLTLLLLILAVQPQTAQAAGFWSWFSGMWGGGSARTTTRSSVNWMAGKQWMRDSFNLVGGNSTVAERAMSRGEFKALVRRGQARPYTFLSRDGRSGPHHVTPNQIPANRQTATNLLALPTPPQVAVRLEVPKGAFNPPEVIPPKYGRPGGLLQQTSATGSAPGSASRDIPVRIIGHRPIK